MLRRILAESGIAISEDEIDADSDSYLVKRLEDQVKQQTQAAEKARSQAEALSRQLDEAKAREQEHLQRIGRLEQDKGLLSSPQSPSGEAASSDARVAAAERKLAESEAAHKKKVQQLESDYQTAVQYVK
jgi:hypothetical protein